MLNGDHLLQEMSFRVSLGGPEEEVIRVLGVLQEGSMGESSPVPRRQERCVEEGGG